MTQTAVRATLLIVTFNQERFIEEAFSAALAQDYQPLQIVIADDGSTDRTTDIVREMAQAYDGPHSILIIDGLPNVGLFGNIQRGFKQATGDLIVIGAGDDVPFPYRVSTMVEAWRNTGAVSLHSQYDIIDDAGNTQATGMSSDAPGHIIWTLFNDQRDRMFVGGATAAYSRAFLASFPQTSRRIFHEDSMLTLAAHATGQSVGFVPVSTIRYRVHGGSYSNKKFTLGSAKEIAISENSHVRFAADSLAYMNYLSEDWFSQHPSTIKVKELLSFERYRTREYNLRCTVNALSPSFYKRTLNVFGSKDFRQFRTSAVRLFGLNVFSNTKALLRKLKSSL